MRDAAHDSARTRRRCDQAVRRSADGSASRPGQVPGQVLPRAPSAEQKVDYEVEAVGFMEKHKFAAHAKGWGVRWRTRGRVSCAKSLDFATADRPIPYLRYKNTLGILSALYLYLRYSRSLIPKVSEHLRYLRYSIPVP